MAVSFIGGKNRSEYPEKTADLPLFTDKLYDIMLIVVSSTPGNEPIGYQLSLFLWGILNLEVELPTRCIFSMRNNESKLNIKNQI